MVRQNTIVDFSNHLISSSSILPGRQVAAHCNWRMFSKTHSVYFNPFWDNHFFVFVGIYGQFFDYTSTYIVKHLEMTVYTHKKKKWSLIIKQNWYLENMLVYKTHSVPISAYSNAWAGWLGLSEFLKKKKRLFPRYPFYHWISQITDILSTSGNSDKNRHSPDQKPSPQWHKHSLTYSRPSPHIHPNTNFVLGFWHIKKALVSLLFEWF